MTPSPAIPIASAATKASRVLIVGATGFMGRFVAEASLATGSTTFLLVRPGPLNTSKAASIKGLQDKGAIVIHGVINDKENMEKILKKYEIDILVSAVGPRDSLDQLILVEAMKSLKTIKRFIPSEFGHDVDRAEPVEPGLGMYKKKRVVRRVVEQSGVPYTFICCNSIASWPYYNNCHPSQLPPPLDRLHIYGDGTVKAYFVDGADIGKFTMKAAQDPRTLNKTLHFRPQINCYSINDLAALWEAKIGRSVPRVTISEEHLLAVAAQKIEPDSVVASFTHDIFIKGCQVNFPLDDPRDLEITALYPHETVRSLEDCFQDFALMIQDHNDPNIPMANEPKTTTTTSTTSITSTNIPMANEPKTTTTTSTTSTTSTTTNSVVEALPITAMC